MLLLRSVDFFLFFLFVRFCVFHFFVSAHRRPLDSSRAPPTNNNVHFFEFSFARNDSQALLARTSPVNTHTHDSIMCDQLRATFHWPPAYMTRSRSLHGAGELNENNNYVARSLWPSVSISSASSQAAKIRAVRRGAATLLSAAPLTPVRRRAGAAKWSARCATGKSQGEPARSQMQFARSSHATQRASPTILSFVLARSLAVASSSASGATCAGAGAVIVVSAASRTRRPAAGGHCTPLWTSERASGSTPVDCCCERSLGWPTEIETK